MRIRYFCLGEGKAWFWGFRVPLIKSWLCFLGEEAMLLELSNKSWH